MDQVYANIGTRQLPPPDGEYEGRQSGYALSFKVSVNGRPTMFHMTTEVGVRGLDQPVKITIVDGVITNWLSVNHKGCTSKHCSSAA